MQLRLVLNQEPKAMIKDVLEGLVDVYPAVTSTDHAHLVTTAHFTNRIRRIKEAAMDADYQDAIVLDRIVQAYNRLISKAQSVDLARDKTISHMMKKYIAPLCAKYNVPLP